MTDVLDVLRTYDQKPYLLQLQYASPERYALAWRDRRLAFRSRTYDSKLIFSVFIADITRVEYRLREFLETESVHYLSSDDRIPP